MRAKDEYLESLQDRMGYSTTGLHRKLDEMFCKLCERLDRIEDKMNEFDRRLDEKGIGAAYSAAFENWWKNYPIQGRKGGKKAAWEKYKSAVRMLNAIGCTDANQYLLDAVVAYKSSLPPDPEYVPHARTWLSQGRYDDEIETTRERGSFYGQDEATRAEMERVRRFKAGEVD